MLILQLLRKKKNQEHNHTRLNLNTHTYTYTQSVYTISATTVLLLIKRMCVCFLKTNEKNWLGYPEKRARRGGGCSSCCLYANHLLEDPKMWKATAQQHQFCFLSCNSIRWWQIKSVSLARLRVRFLVVSECVSTERTRLETRVGRVFVYARCFQLTLDRVCQRQTPRICRIVFSYRLLYLLNSNDVVQTIQSVTCCVKINFNSNYDSHILSERTRHADTFWL